MFQREKLKAATIIDCSGFKILWRSLVILELFKLVARPGFEPRQTESESVVLPLYYRALRELGGQMYKFFEKYPINIIFLTEQPSFPW